MRRRSVAALLASVVAFQPVLANAEQGFFYRAKPVSGESAATLSQISEPTDVEAHKDDQTYAQYVLTGGNNVIWSATGFPSGVTINPSTGRLTVLADAAGSYQGTVKVSADGASQTLPVTLNVRDTLVIVGQQDRTGHVHVTSDYPVLTVQGEPLLPLPLTWTWALGAEIPAGLTLDPTSGVISGIHTQGGISVVALKATDQTGADALSGTFKIAVAGNLVIADAVVPGRVDTPLAGYAPTYTGTPYGTLHWSVSGGQLPSGLTMDDPTGLVHGTPTAATPGDAALGPQVQVIDDTKVPAYGALPVVVYAPLAIQAPATPLVMRYGQYSTLPALTVLHVPAAGGTWTASGLPAGVSLNASTGTIYGTPAAQGASAPSLSYVDGAGAVAPPLSVQLSVIPGLTIDKPLDAVGDTVGTLYALTPSLTAGSVPVGQETWKLVYDSGDPIPSGVMIQDPTIGQIVGTSDFGSTTVAHFEVSDQSGAPPVESDTFDITFTTDFEVGNVADLVMHTGDTDYTAAPTISNTRTGQDLTKDLAAITWARVCAAPGRAVT